jgi:hypothetical protein
MAGVYSDLRPTTVALRRSPPLLQSLPRRPHHHHRRRHRLHLLLLRCLLRSFLIYRSILLLFYSIWELFFVIVINIRVVVLTNFRYLNLRFSKL